MKLSYFGKIMSTFNYKKMFNTIDKIHKRSNKNIIGIFFDIIYCGFKYGAGYSDYFLYEFEKIPNKKRKDYITRSYNNKLIKLLNNQNEVYKLSDKSTFNKIFADFIKRNWLNLNSATERDFEDFVKSVKCLAVKPQNGCCGQGFEKIYTSDINNINELYQRLKRENKTIIEEYVIQHKDISKIYPYSVNTLRIATINHNNKISVVYGFIRIGNNNACVDNINAGGMCAPIDINTGKITHQGYDKDGKTYEIHPQTKTKLIGYQIPLWDKAKEMCINAAKLIPEIGYVGWDICVTENDVLLIEGNEFPGHDILQLPAHNPEHNGMLPIFRQYVPEL